MISNEKKEFIEFMIKSGVLTFGDFLTKSGRNTPYFINTGNYKTGEQIAKLGEFYADLINKKCKSNFDALFGPAYKGIPLSAVTAATLYNKYNIDKPYFFNRKEAKDHGEGGNTVGYKPKENDRIIIVEDVITAGTAIRETMPVIKNCAENIIVSDMFISVDRCEFGKNHEKTAVMEVNEEFGIKIHSIVNVRDIFEYLKYKDGTNSMLEKMKAYMDKYCIL